MMEMDQIRALLEQHKDKNFVQRILNPQEYPAKDFGYGRPSTHLMSWGEVGPDRTPIVYPTVIYDQRSGDLIELSPASAQAHAVATGEFIPFNDKVLADWFSKYYKKIWQAPSDNKVRQNQQRTRKVDSK